MLDAVLCRFLREFKSRDVIVIVFFSALIMVFIAHTELPLLRAHNDPIFGSLVFAKDTHGKRQEQEQTVEERTTTAAQQRWIEVVHIQEC